MSQENNRSIWKSPSLDAGFVMLPLDLLDMVADKGLSSKAFHVLALFLRYARQGNLEVFPSQATLAKSLGTTNRTTVRCAIKEVVDAFGITVEKVKTKTGYYHRYNLAPLVDALATYSHEKNSAKPAQKAALPAANEPTPTPVVPMADIPELELEPLDFRNAVKFGWLDRDALRASFRNSSDPAFERGLAGALAEGSIIETNGKYFTEPLAA